jgi:hypothetical protein
MYPAGCKTNISNAIVRLYGNGKFLEGARFHDIESNWTKNYIARKFDIGNYTLFVKQTWAPEAVRNYGVSLYYPY